MKTNNQNLDQLDEELLTDKNGDGEQLQALLNAFTANIPVRCKATLIGKPVSILKFEFDGNERRGITAKIRAEDGAIYVVAAADLAIRGSKRAVDTLAAYRKWLGIGPQHIVLAESKTKALDLVVLTVKQRTARCRLVGSDQVLDFRTSRLRELVPGEIAVVGSGQINKNVISGTLESIRIDAALLGVSRLKVENRGVWNPVHHYWGEKGEPIENWAKPIIKRGRRPEFEMEQILPGFDSSDYDSDPIGQSVDLADAGDFVGAGKILMSVCEEDIRCLDAHAHLGNLLFDKLPAQSIRHYEVGYRIGEWSLEDSIDGVLPWGWIDNRPFLRCMYGYGLCLWRLERFAEAEKIFQKILWLNPSDNQGARFVIDEVRAKKSWKPD